MKCERARDVMVLELYGEAGTREAGELRFHLQECAACVAEGGDLEGAARILARAEGRVPARRLPLPEAGTATRRWITALRIAGLAAMVFAGVGLAVVLNRSRPATNLPAASIGSSGIGTLASTLAGTTEAVPSSTAEISGEISPSSFPASDDPSWSSELTSLDKALSALEASAQEF